MTSATDNRTTELREKLTECGVKWRSGLDGVTFVGDWCFVEYDNGNLAATCEPVLTPEQAIAATLGGEYKRGYEDGLHANTKAAFAAAKQAISATLGRPKAKSHPYGYERDTGAYDCTRCECGCINDISATYCNDCGGEIEIDESAEKEYYDGYSKHTVFAKKHDDGSLEFCERRYVHEDAATLGAERKVYVLRGTDPGTMPSFGGETNELLGVYATREAAEGAKEEYGRMYCDLNVTEWEVD